MRYFHIITIFIFLLNSCATLYYDREFYSIEQINLDDGHWLINHIDADLYLNAKREFTEKLVRKLKVNRNENIVFIEDLDIDTLGHEIIKFEVSDTKLHLLKELTDFDYLLNTRLMVVSVNIADNPESEEDKETVIYRTIFHIYDLNSGKIVFEQIAEIKDAGDNENGNSIDRRDLRKLYKSLKRSVNLLKDSPTVNVENGHNF